MIINKAFENKKLKNNILALGAEASNAKKKNPQVINATSGMFKGEDGSLYEFISVKNAIDSLNASQKFSYANTTGSTNFKRAIFKSIFGKYQDEVSKNNFYDVIPTPGGTGALNVSFFNYAEKGDVVLLPNYMWENYMNLCEDMSVNYDTYRLFDDCDLFDIKDLNNKVSILSTKQKRIMMLINDPCQNPTGFCMKDEDYDALLRIAYDYPNNDFVYVIDIAYFDFYSADLDIIRNRFAKFKDVPNNALALFTYSGSKSFGLYGLRIGALLALSKSEKEIECFHNASAFASRTKWSNATHLGMNIIEALILNEQFHEQYLSEIKEVCSLLEKRGQTFINSAKEVGLKILPYQRGFFASIPCANSEKVMLDLQKDGVYLIPMKDGLRIALSSVNLEEAKRLPIIIKKHLG